MGFFNTAIMCLIWYSSWKPDFCYINLQEFDASKVASRVVCFKFSPFRHKVLYISYTLSLLIVFRRKLFSPWLFPLASCQGWFLINEYSHTSCHFVSPKGLLNTTLLIPIAWDCWFLWQRTRHWLSHVWNLKASF